MHRLIAILFVIAVLAGSAPTSAQAMPTQPLQPKTGPGGSTYRYESVEARHIGDNPTGSWMFWPARSDDQPLPVIVFLHGFSAVDPLTYQGWIDHIVKRGAIVMFPDYQSGNPLATNPAEFQANAIAGIELALVELQSGSAGAYALEHFAMLGHSLGGILTLNLAAVAAEEGLPAPDIIMPVEPGGCSECGGLSTLIGQPFEDLGQIPASTTALIGVGDQDTVVGDTAAQIAWTRMTAVPVDQRDYVIINSDSTGTPALVADHFAPESGGPNGETDALDWYGYWKLFDLLTDCSFHDLNCDQSIGGSPQQLDMGEWSDGTPVTPPTITKSP